MNLKKAWAAANDIWFMPVNFGRFYIQNLMADYNKQQGQKIEPCAKPGRISRFFNHAALGTVAAIGITNASSAPLLSGISATTGALLASAIMFAGWGSMMVFRDKLLPKVLGGERYLTSGLGGYMFPRLHELNKPVHRRPLKFH